MSKIRVLMVDDHRIVLEGISSLLSQYSDIEVISKSECPVEALASIERNSPDVVITDLSMPDVHGNDFIKSVHANYPDLPIIVLSMHTEYFAIQSAMRAGASAFLQKTCSAKDLKRAIYTVLEGNTFFTDDIREILSQEEPDASLSQLTKREKQILALICQGKSSSIIGNALHISSRTVDNHRAHMMRKLGVKNTAELVKQALLNQLV